MMQPRLWWPLLVLLLATPARAQYLNAGNGGSSSSSAVDQANINGRLYPQNFPGADLCAQINNTWASSACPSTGCVLDASGVSGDSSCSGPIVVTGKPIRLILGGNQTYSGTALAAATSSGSTACVAGTCTATITTAANHGFSTGWTVKIKNVSPQQYNGVFQIVVTGLNTFTYVMDAGSSPGNISVQGSAEAGFIQLGTGTDGSEIACYGQAHSSGQAGIPSTGNRQAVWVRPSTGSMPIVAVASGVQGVKIHGCQWGSSPNVDDGIVIGAGDTNTGVYDNLFSGVQPIGFSATGGTGEAVFFDGRVSDNSVVFRNQIYGWTNGIRSDATNVGTSGGTYGPWIAGNLIFEASGDHFIRVSNSFDPYIEHNETGFSSMNANACGIQVDGAGTITPYIILNHFDGSNLGGNSNTADTCITNTVGGVISGNSYDGNTNNSNPTDDPDRAVDLGSNAFNVVVSANNIGNYASGGVKAAGTAANNIAVYNNTFTVGHAGTGAVIVSGSTGTNGGLVGTLNGVLNVNMFAGSDICAQFNAAIAVAQGNASTGVGLTTVFWPAGMYTATSQCLIPNFSSVTQAAAGAIEVRAYGVQLATSGSLDGFQDQAGGNDGKVTIYGLRILNNNSSQVHGFNFGGVYQGACVDCSVIVTTATPLAGYEAVRVGTRVPGTSNTFTQSMKLDRLQIHNTIGVDTPIGVALEHAENVSILHSQIDNNTVAIQISDDPSGTDGIVSYETTIEDNDIEGEATAIKVVQNTSVGNQTGGWRIVHNTFDGGVSNNATVLDLSSGPSGVYQAPPYLSSNFVLGSFSQFVNDPALNHPVNSINNTIASAASAYGQRMVNGINVGQLGVSGGTTGGVQGSLGINQLPALTRSVNPVCTVAGGETCSTQRCYRIAPVDYAGLIGPLEGELCTSVGPDTLTSSNFVQNAVTVSNQPGVCGVRVYGRATGAEQFMDPTGKTCNGVDVSMLVQDRTRVLATTSPAFNDTGAITPSGALPSGNATGLLTTSAAGIQYGLAQATPGSSPTATLGQTGGAGPATAAQQGWIQLLDSTGAKIWVPVWK